MDIISSLHLDFTLKNSFRTEHHFLQRSVFIFVNWLQSRSQNGATMKWESIPITIAHIWMSITELLYLEFDIDNGWNHWTMDKWSHKLNGDKYTRNHFVIAMLRYCPLIDVLTTHMNKKRVIHVKPLGEPSFSSSDIHCLLRYICMYIF